MNNSRSTVLCLIQALILLHSVSAALASDRKILPADYKPQVTKSSGWLQEKAYGEKLIQIKESSGSIYLAAKLITGDGDIPSARSFLRKASSDLSVSKIAQSGLSMQEQIGLLCNDFAFLQSLETETAKVKPRIQRNEFQIQHLKDVEGDYDILITAAEKQLGQADPQVKSLKQLQAVLRTTAKMNEPSKDRSKTTGTK